MATVLEPQIQELADLLNEEARLYGELLALGEQERGAVVGNDLSWLNSLVAEKDRVVMQIARVETERQAWIGAWSAARGATETVTLAELARQLTPADAERVTAVRDTLLARVRDVAQMNHQNGTLLTSALRIVDRSIETYSRLSGGNGYEPSGERTRATRTVVLDQRI